MKKMNGNKFILLIIVLYGLLMSAFGLDYNSPFYDETFPIVLGRQLLSGEPCPGCPYMTGSVLIQPVIVAFGDSIGGLHGARAMNILFGLALTLVIYLTARVLFNDERLGLIAAAIFVCSGQTLYLMKLATYDMIAAFFLGSAFLLLIVAEKTNSNAYRIVALLEGSIALFLASITKFLLPIFIPPLVLYVLVKHGQLKTALYCILPLMILALFYFCFAPYPPLSPVMGQIDLVREASHISLRTLADWMFRWIAMAYLFAVFGIFHNKWGRYAVTLIALSAPIIIIHLATQTEQSVNKNMIFAIVFIAPAAALGVDKLASLFTVRNTNLAVRTFFTVALILVFSVYGYRNLKWLEKQYPDMTPVLEYLDENGFDGMNVAMNVWGNSIYTYTLGSRYPEAHFFHIEEIDITEDSGSTANGHVDFIICEDTFYGEHCPCSKFEEYIDKHFVLLEDFPIQLSWGMTEARIFGRR